MKRKFRDSFQFVVFLLIKYNNKLKAVAEIFSLSELQRFEMFKKHILIGKIETIDLYPLFMKLVCNILFSIFKI